MIRTKIFCLTYQVTRCYVLIHDLNGHIVANVLDINIKGLVPLGNLATALNRSSLKLLLSSLKDAVGVHLAEGLGVSG